MRGSASLLVGSDQRVQLRLDHTPQFPDHCQIRVDVAFFLPVENLIAVQVDFESTVCARSQGNRDVWPKCSKEFVGHPRGRGVMLSRDAVHNVYEDLPFRIC